MDLSTDRGRARAAGVIGGVLLACAGSGCGSGLGTLPVLYAQTVPVNLGARWNPNPASEGVTQYQLVVDGGAPVTVLASTCSATECAVRFDVAAYGPHTATLVAQNLQLSTDPTSLQSSVPPVSLSFVLSARPGAVTGGTVRP